MMSNQSLHRSGLVLRRACPSRWKCCAGRTRQALSSAGEFKRWAAKHVGRE